MQRQNNWRRHGSRGGGNRGGGNRGRGGGSRQSNAVVRNPLRQQMDSNGPLGRVRGNAMQIMDKYLVLAKEAMSDGDRVLAEACLQYAEHYQRLITEHQGQFKPSDDDGMSSDNYGDNDSQQPLPRSGGMRGGNGGDVRMMSRGVVRYVDDNDNEESSGNENANGEDLPSFLTGNQRAVNKRKSNRDDDME